ALLIAQSVANDLPDVSFTADAALSNAQSAFDLAGLAATQIDLNATIDDLNDPLKPRIHRWVSSVITEADIPPASGS
ncbi:hypothetical protein U2086_14930, partial [Listeria monocytogenes]|uniref:hypothetical protein n=1 Tax=Listeria monocytogenes TaxID=1639 RepID=UPI002FDBA293